MVTRRGFVKGSMVAMFGMGAAPLWMQRTALAANSGGGRRKVLVAVFQRGAVDGLNMVLPFAEKEYYRLRPNLAIPAPARDQATGGALDLDGFFGLHPSLAGLKPLWDARELAVVHAVGSPDPTRSHFDAQDYMEAGTPGVKSTRDGWMNRAIVDEEGHLVAKPKVSPVRAVAIGTSLPRSLQGEAPAVAIGRLDQFQVRNQKASNAFSSIYGAAADDLMQTAGKEAFDAISIVQRIARQPKSTSAKYPNGQLSNSLRQIAALIKADVGLEVASAEMGGWDHHVNEVGPRPTVGQLANMLSQFGDAIAAFRQDLGDRIEDVLLVTMSEFGRTAKENGTRGTDHGHANVMLAMGGGVRGGKVYGSWPGLAREQLHEGRDLAVTTDFRRVLGEAVYRHLGKQELQSLFPGYRLQPSQFLGIMGS